MQGRLQPTHRHGRSLPDRSAHSVRVRVPRHIQCDTICRARRTLAAAHHQQGTLAHSNLRRQHARGTIHGTDNFSTRKCTAANASAAATTSSSRSRIQRHADGGDVRLQRRRLPNMQRRRRAALLRSVSSNFPHRMPGPEIHTGRGLVLRNVPVRHLRAVELPARRVLRRGDAAM